MRSAGILFASALLCSPLVAVSAAPPADGVPPVVDLIPAERAAWTPKNVLVGISGMFGGWNYWYAERTMEVETVPPDAVLGLYYLRQNFQKRFERTDAPATVKLPARADTTRKDAIRIHASANGYLAKDVSFSSDDVPERVTITLSALPNSLVFLGQTSFAGRTTLTLRTTEQPEVRLTKTTRSSGFTIALTRTALKLESPAAGTGARLKSIDASQVGEDAIVRVETDSPDVEVRSKQSFDPVSSHYVSIFDLVQPASAAPSDVEIRARLDATPFTPNADCDRRYAEVLRSRLGESAITDALRPSGGITDLYRREAMLRLGRYRDGTVRTESGETLRTGSSLELALALQSAASVEGYLALLGALARTEPQPADALRSLIAPQLSAKEFAPVYEAAEATRASCHR
jgi:hypothetical protein